MITGALDRRRRRGAHLRPRPRPSTARRSGAAAASCRPSPPSTTGSSGCDNLALLAPSSTAWAATPTSTPIRDAADRFGIDARPRPAGRRLLDRHEDPPGAGPVGAARARPAAVRRADVGPRPRVVPRRARAHPRDDRRRAHRRHVHPPAARGRGPGRPGRRARGRRRPRRRHARRAAPAASGPTPWSASTPRTATALDRGSRRRRRAARYDRDGDGRLAVPARRPRAACPTSSSRSPPPGVRLTRVEPHEPTLEDLYFAVRGRSDRRGRRTSRTPCLGDRSAAAPTRRSTPVADTVAAAARPGELGPGAHRRPHRPAASSSQAKDFWVPDGRSSARSSSSSSRRSCCSSITRRRRRRRSSSSCRTTLEVLPAAAQDAIQGDTAPSRRPRTRSPCTCSRPSPSSCRSRSRPPSAPPPSSASASGAPASSSPTPPPPSRDLPRQADRQPHPRLPHDDRRLRRLLACIVNLIVGPEVGGWFFPTAAVVGADALGACRRSWRSPCRWCCACRPG